MFDLMVSFAEANRKVLDDAKNSSRLFLDFTNLLEKILYLLNNIIVEIDEDYLEEIQLIGD